MISVWNLIWLLLVAAVFGFEVCGLLGANREAENEVVLKVFREERDAMMRYIKQLEKVYMEVKTDERKKRSGEDQAHSGATVPRDRSGEDPGIRGAEIP